MDPREIQKYNGKAVNFGNYHGPATGIVYDGVCYNLEPLGIHAKQRLIVKLHPEPAPSLEHIYEREEALVTPLEKAVLQALKEGKKEVLLKIEIKKLDFGQR